MEGRTAAFPELTPTLDGQVHVAVAVKVHVHVHADDQVRSSSPRGQPQKRLGSLRCISLPSNTRHA
jgi:hypothetical protein